LSIYTDTVNTERVSGDLRVPPTKDLRLSFFSEALKVELGEVG
jgi:hypothetical protein